MSDGPLSANGIAVEGLVSSTDTLEIGRELGTGLAANYHRPPCTTSSNGRRLGLRIGFNGRSAG